MPAVLFDLDGVLYEGDTPIAGAAKTVSWFRKNGIPFLFLTNTTSISRDQLVSKLAGFGIDNVQGDIHFRLPAGSAQPNSPDIK